MLATRIASAMIFAPVLIAAGYYGGPLLWLYAGTVVTLGLVEFDRLVAVIGPRAWPALTVPFGLGLVAAAAAGRSDLLGAILTAALFASVIVPTVYPSRVKALDGLVSLGGVVYVGWLGAHWVSLRALPGGVVPFFVGLIGTWVFDTASYFGGATMGRHKLAPRVSPGKTVEGLIAGVAFGAVVIVWLGREWMNLGWLESAVLAVVIMAASQFGDLAESALKRQAKVKDSGTLIPGHGGVLDRFDSLLAVWPAVYYLWVLWLGVPG